MFHGLEKPCLKFENNSIKRISINFSLNEEDAQSWFEKVQVNPMKTISESIIETTIGVLKTINILHNSNKNYNSISFIDGKFSNLTVVIKPMRLYNKSELLIILKNNLRNVGLSKDSLSYIDLLPYDQNHYYGTKVLDIAVEDIQIIIINKIRLYKLVQT